MANPEHVAVVRKGADAIAEWRRANPRRRLDLAGADLRRAKLASADLRRAKLTGADLRMANLARASLVRANVVEARLTRAHLGGAWLSSSDMTEADLSRAKLFLADLSWANLRRANLSGADLTGAHLLGADLRRANFSGADLSPAHLMTANLAEANLSQSDLKWANLSGADLSGTSLSEARLGSTSLSAVDLSKVIGLGTVKHESASSVGVHTLLRSFRGAGNRLTPELRTFFRGAGVPKELLEALPGIVAEVNYYSCFIAYGEPDVEFARKLRQDLWARGVSCWVYDMDKTPGERIWGEIERKLEEYERMVVLCSIDALMREGVKREIDKQIDKNPDKLVPVSLEKRWTYPGFEARWGSRDVKTWLLERNYADFAGWESDPSRYEKGLEELLRGLRRKDE